LQRNDHAKQKKKSAAKESIPLPPSILTKTTRIEENPMNTTLALDLHDTVITGTDYGITTLAVTVSHTKYDLDLIKNGKYVKLPKPTKLVAKDLQWKSGNYQFTKKLERAKKVQHHLEERNKDRNSRTRCTSL
jgi:ribosomal protein S15P/S13E